MHPADFYTGIVAEVYGALRGTHFEASHYRDFIQKHGTPALELGCGDEGPFYELVADGLDVEGMDSSQDMLDRGQRRLAAAGLSARLHHQRMEDLKLGRKFASIYLAGPTFNLLADDATAAKALTALAEHLAPEGAALVPLWTPPPTPRDQIGRTRSAQMGESTASFVIIAEDYDQRRRTRTTTLRYQLDTESGSTVEDRDWVIHWYTPEGFRDLAAEAGLNVTYTEITEDETEAHLTVRS